MTVPRADAGRDGMASDGRRAVVVIGVAVLLALSIAGVAGTAVAIDQVAILSPEPMTVNATPGETITIDLSLWSQGGHGGEGVSAVTVVAQYHPDYLEVTDIERGPWLESDDTDIRTATAIANEQGTTVIKQRREPVAGGTAGSGTIATLTVNVTADAPAGTTTISFAESTVDLTGDYMSALVDESATITIAGGNESLESYNHTDPDDLSLEFDETDDASDDGTAGSGGGLSIPGFSAGLALVAVSVVAGVLWFSRERRH
ncbi:cohesin domain-containing protein [Natrinema hispanicum]|uniref:Cohesin domain-containing protein n=1 Tax=Natrinema hispanicum TaxID=392421 RepID=A0A1I0FZT8_9EURY|nr:cohesin domain-containing protein [Natrinema hispanicum]SDC81006.1 Cohesin domain-containing protein [Natrinema hispanicum]SET63831.1 Cohesin domain-containing protein [Natrinema hispanicum]